MRQLSDDALLTMLAGALEPPDVHPEVAELERLRNLLDGPDAVPVVPLPLRDRVHPLHRLRHPIAAAATAAILISGSAAAAVGTDTLPGPLRTIAFSLGLPVDSPALEAAQGDMSALEGALNTDNLAATRLDATLLRSALVRLDPSDRVQIWVAAQLLLARADDALAAQGDGSDHGSSGTPGSPRHGGDGSGPTSQTNGSTPEGGTRDGTEDGSTDGGRDGGTSDGGSESGTSGPTGSTGSSGPDGSGGQTSGGTSGSDGGGPGPGGSSGPVSSGGSVDGSNSGPSDGSGSSTTSHDGSGTGTSGGEGASLGTSDGGGSDGDESSGSSGSNDR
jgi:hypothetical protein